MEFGWSEEQLRLRDEIVRFAESELNDDLIQRDVDSEFPLDAWKKCAAFGIQGLPMPTEYGGSGVDALTVMLAMEALGYGCRDNGLIFSINAQMWSCEIPILRSGTDAPEEPLLAGALRRFPHRRSVYRRNLGRAPTRSLYGRPPRGRKAGTS